LISQIEDEYFRLVKPSWFDDNAGGAWTIRQVCHPDSYLLWRKGSLTSQRNSGNVSQWQDIQNSDSIRCHSEAQPEVAAKLRLRPSAGLIFEVPLEATRE